MNWYVLCTKVRNEKKVAQRLEDLGIEVYCPLITETRKWSDRKKKVTFPLFNSYIFVRLEKAQRNIVFVPGVIRFLYWLGQPAIVRNEEIEAIQKSLTLSNTHNLELEKISEGDRVFIKAGLFESQYGIIKEISANQYVLILDSLGCVLKITKKEQSIISKLS